MGHSTPVGITKNNHVRPGRQRSFYDFGPVTGVVFITIKEMLGIKEHFFAQRFQIFNRVSNHGQIFFQINFENFGYMKIPCFSNYCHSGSAGFYQRLEIRAGFSTDMRLARAAKCRQF